MLVEVLCNVVTGVAASLITLVLMFYRMYELSLPTTIARFCASGLESRAPLNWLEWQRRSPTKESMPLSEGKEASPLCPVAWIIWRGCNVRSWTVPDSEFCRDKTTVHLRRRSSQIADLIFVLVQTLSSSKRA